MLSAHCQMLFFSATYDKEVMDFARLIVTEPTIIRYVFKFFLQLKVKILEHGIS